MALLSDERAIELAGGVRAVRSAAHEVASEQLSKGRERLRTRQKTRKSELTRQKIMDAATELMTERGNVDFQMSEVSDRCRMSKGALYYYFSDRDELIGAIFDESVDDLVSGIESVAATSTSAVEALRDLYSEFTRRLRAGSPLALAMTYEIVGSADSSVSEMTSHFSRASHVIAAQLERAKAEGAVRPDIDSQVAADFITGGLVTTSLMVASGQRADDADQIAAGVNGLLLHGVGASGAGDARQ